VTNNETTPGPGQEPVDTAQAEVPGGVEVPDLEVIEHRGAWQLDVLADRLPEALHAAADWLTDHDRYTVTGLNCSLVDNGTGGRSRPMHLLTVGLADDNTLPVRSTLTYPSDRTQASHRSTANSGDGGLGGGFGGGGGVLAAQVDWHGPGVYKNKPQASEWTVDVAEDVLRYTRPSGRTFLRALVAEHGRATPARLRELTGMEHLHHGLQTVNNAARKVVASGLLGDHGRRLVLSAQDPANPRHPNVHEYVLPGQLVPLFAEAFDRIQATDHP
jgi:hypothetical protein